MFEGADHARLMVLRVHQGLGHLRRIKFSVGILNCGQIILNIHLHDVNGLLDRVNANPAEGRLAAFRLLGFVDEADGLQHIGDVIQSANLSLQALFVQVLFVV